MCAHGLRLGIGWSDVLIPMSNLPSFVIPDSVEALPNLAVVRTEMSSKHVTDLKK